MLIRGASFSGHTGISHQGMQQGNPTFCQPRLLPIPFHLHAILVHGVPVAAQAGSTYA